MNIGKAIKAGREAANITQLELATKSGRQVWYIKAVEQGTETPTNGDIKEIAKALNVPVEILKVLGIEDSDVAPGRQHMYDVLFPAMKELALSLMKPTKK